MNYDKGDSNQTLEIIIIDLADKTKSTYKLAPEKTEFDHCNKVTIVLDTEGVSSIQDWPEAYYCRTHKEVLDIYKFVTKYSELYINDYSDDLLDNPLVERVSITSIEDDEKFAEYDSYDFDEDEEE